MEPLTVAVAAAAVVLTVSGATKLATPLPTERMLDALGTPGWRGRARTLGAVEVLVAAVLVLAGGRWPPLVAAVVYVTLTVVANRAMVSAPDLPCGCVGSRSSPVGTRHVVLDGLFAAVLGVAAVASPPPLRGELSGPSVDVASTLAAVVLVAGCAIGVLAGLGHGDVRRAA